MRIVVLVALHVWVCIVVLAASDTPKQPDSQPAGRGQYVTPPLGVAVVMADVGVAVVATGTVITSWRHLSPSASPSSSPPSLPPPLPPPPPLPQ